jgi:addiction module HigA family antidote
MLTTATMKRRPTLPGEMLLEEFLRRAGITQVELAARMDVPIQRVNGVISGRRAATAETAILLSRALGTTAALRLNLQMAVDLWDAERKFGLARPARRRAARGRGATSAHR